MKVELKKPEQDSLEARIEAALRRDTALRDPYIGAARAFERAAHIAAQEAEKNPAPDNFPATVTITVESLEEAWVLRALFGFPDSAQIVRSAHEPARRPELRALPLGKVDAAQMTLYRATLELTK